jgi:ssRNA-specific RNase YbeY (16S rRNA maturation enzyme)
MTDNELLELNESYLNHDDYTDVITFDLSEKPNNFAYL